MSIFGFTELYALRSSHRIPCKLPNDCMVCSVMLISPIKPRPNAHLNGCIGRVKLVGGLLYEFETSLMCQALKDSPEIHRSLCTVRLKLRNSRNTSFLSRKSSDLRQSSLHHIVSTPVDPLRSLPECCSLQIVVFRRLNLWPEHWVFQST